MRLTIDVLAFALNDTPQRVADADMNALLDGPPDALQSALDDAAARLASGVVVQTDAGPGVIESAAYPSFVEIDRWKKARHSPRLPVILDARVTGQLPAHATTVAFRFPEALGSIVLTIETPGAEPRAFAINGGDSSPAVALTQTPAALAPGQPGRIFAALSYVRLGFTHIVPHGPDHILFVLGLFLLSPRIQPLLWQISAFTIAHSITLALSMYGIFRLPPNIVEPLIAASIAFVAIENLWTTKLKPWRPAVVFAFGLIHGLGFAGVLLELGLPRHDFATALIGFNVGVELGQLAVVLAALLLVSWFQKRAWYRPAVVMPASILIALIGLFWTVQRIL